MNKQQIAVGYVRVSTADQANNGVSLAAQKARIEAWAGAHGYTLLDAHVDAGLSGSKAENRPALQAALAQACKQKAALVVYSLSRLARSTRDAIGISERLEKAGADLVSLSESIDTRSAAGRLYFAIIAAFAQFERECLGERTRMGMAHLRSQNRRISRHVPFGFDLSGDGATLLPNASEQRVLKLMRKLRGQGHSLRSIACLLSKRGHRTKSGATAWSPGVIAAILDRTA